MTGRFGRVSSACTFAGCVVTGSVLTGSVLTGCVLAGCVLTGCAQSAVPSLDPADFQQPALSELTPRALAVQVRDERPIAAEDRRATEEQLRSLLEQLLNGAGVSPDAQAKYALLIVVRQPSQADRSMDPGSCVELSWELRAAGTLTSTNVNSACAAVQDGYGATAPDLSRAFRRALRSQLGELERTTAQAAELSAPLQFDAGQIAVPAFEWLRPRSLALKVKDELEAGGAAGAELTRSLTEALTRSGLLVSDQAAQRLSLTLGRPREASTEQERRTCVELRAELEGASARRFVSRRDCPRVGSPLGPRVINGVLRGIDGSGATSDGS